MQASNGEQQGPSAARAATPDSLWVAGAFFGAFLLLGLASAKSAGADEWPSSLDGTETSPSYRIDFSQYQIAQAGDAGPLQQFDIPAGDLQSALLQFSQAVDLQLL